MERVDIAQLFPGISCGGNDCVGHGHGQLGKCENLLFRLSICMSLLEMIIQLK